MSSSEYRITGRIPVADTAREEDAGSVRVARVSVSSPAIALPSIDLDEDDLALTRAPTEQLPADLAAQLATSAIGTEPPPVRKVPALPALPPLAPPALPPLVAPALPPLATPAVAARPLVAAPVAATDPPSARMVTFGKMTLLLVPAGDCVALVVPGVVRITGTRAEADALAQALLTTPRR